MESSSDTAKISRNDLRSSIITLCGELEFKLNDNISSENELEECFLRLEDKVQRLNILDEEFLKKENNNEAKKEQEDIGKWWSNKKNYDSYKKKYAEILARKREKQIDAQSVGAQKIERSRSSEEPQLKFKYSTANKMSASFLEETKELKKGPRSSFFDLYRRKVPSQAKETNENRRASTESELESISSRESESFTKFDLTPKKNDIVDWSEVDGIVERAALGTDGHIGQLYDLTTDTLYPEFLFSKLLSDEYLKIHPNEKFEIKSNEKNRLSYRFKLLDIDINQQLSILGNSFPLSGHGRYLAEEKSSENIISSSLLFRNFAETEMLINKVADDVNTKIFQKDHYTHVVVGIKYGKVCVLNLECQIKDKNQKSAAETLLREEKDRIKASLEVENVSSVNLCINKDVKLKTFVDESTVYQENQTQIPEILENMRHGRGIPLIYILAPLSCFSQSDYMTQNINLVSVDKKSVSRLLHLFETLSNLEMKLHDMENCMLQYEKYFPDDSFKKIKSFFHNIQKNKRELKNNVKEIVSRLRLNEKTIEDLIGVIEKYEDPNSIIKRISKEIKSTNYHSNINFIVTCEKNGITYISKTCTLNTVLLRNINYDCYVLYLSSKLSKADPGTANETCDLFFTMARNPEKNNKYIFIDLDLNVDTAYNYDTVKIFHYKRGEVLSYDVLMDKNADKLQNFAQCQSLFDKAIIRPFKRVALTMTCPGFKLGTCEDKILAWTCVDCKHILEKADDDFIYCDCGKAKFSSFLFKCNFAAHGDGFLEVNQQIRESLDAEELNIVVLGQLNVGKSMWINSIVNYLQYDSVEEAEKGEIFCPIPTRIIVKENDDLTSAVIEVGDKNSEEFVDSEKSACSNVSSFVFKLNDKMIRIIDTPELGVAYDNDIDQDNLEKIWSCITSLNRLHGICILLKDEAKMDHTFKEILIELLSRLQANAAKNIFFCCTNSKKLNFNSGDFSMSFSDLLLELKIKTIIPAAITFTNNAAFLHLCSKRSVDVNESEMGNRIWKNCAMETRNLFEKIKNADPYIIKDSLNYLDSKTRIWHLAVPLAEISRMIQMNIAIMADQIRKISESKKINKSELFLPQVDIEARPLVQPQLICTDSACTKYTCQPGNINTAEHGQVCHDVCFLKCGIPWFYPNPIIKSCGAFEKGEICLKCFHEWQEHRHVTYYQEITISEVDDAYSEAGGRKKSLKGKYEDHEKKLKSTTGKYKEEQKIILQVCLKFRTFLKDAGLVDIHCDSFKNYLEYLIREEQKKPNKTIVDNYLMENMNDLKDWYQELIAARSDNNNNYNSILVDIESLKEELYRLELIGQKIQTYESIFNHRKDSVFARDSSNEGLLRKSRKQSSGKKFLFFRKNK